jgi:hypothetical protein
LLEKGANPRQCNNYPFGIYETISYVCGDDPKLAHELFAELDKYGVYRDFPQKLLWPSIVNNCAEGVSRALKHGASATLLTVDNYRANASTPLRLAVVVNWPRNPEASLEIVKLLVEAGASPWEVDGEGKSIFQQAETKYADSRGRSADPYWSAEYWPKLEKILSDAPSPK